MLQTITLEVWNCTSCSWAWFRKGDHVPRRCPNVKCRKRFGLNQGGITTPRVVELLEFERKTTQLYREMRALDQKEKSHDPKTCHINKCFMCEAAK